MNLTTKIAVALLLVLVAALGMTSVLNYLRFEQTLRTVLAQRIDVVANETSQDLRAGIDLGLRLENMDNLTDLLERRLGMDRDIANISILGCDGEIIGSAGRSSDSTQHTNEMMHGEEQSHELHFHGAVAMQDITLRDSLGQCVGVLRLTTDITRLNGKLTVLRQEMMQSAAFGLIAIVPVFAVLFVIMRRRHRVFDALNEDIARARSGLPPKAPPRDGDLLTRAEVEMVSLYREVRDHLPDDDGDQPGDSTPDDVSGKKGGAS